MSPLQNRAWLALWSMCPPYAVYFGLQILAPSWLNTLLERIACLAATTSVHAAVFLTGLLLFKWRERGQGLVADERDRTIEIQATRVAYYALMAGTIVVGVVMPFNQGGWKIVNAALLAIVLAEALRNLLIVRGYQGTPRLAQ